MLVREGNKILVQKEIKNELFGGRIGRVNGTREDADKIARSLRKVWNRTQMEIVNISQGNTFFLKGSFIDKKSQIFYSFDIEEKGKAKICIYLYREMGSNTKTLDSKAGLILSDKKIIEALESLFRKQGITSANMVAPKQKDAATFKPIHQSWSQEVIRDLNDEKAKQKQIQKEIEKSARSWASQKNYTDNNIAKIVYNKDFLADTGYSRMDMDPYSTAWI